MSKRAVPLTYENIMASSRDAGNRSMRKACRKRWNEDDWNAAAAVAERLGRAAGLVPPAKEK